MTVSAEFTNQYSSPPQQQQQQQADKSILVGHQQIIYILKGRISQILFLVKNSLFTPYSYRLSSHMCSILVYTSPSMQTRWSFDVHGVHAEGHDTGITCLSCVCGWNNAWLLFMEALANMIVMDIVEIDHRGLFIQPCLPEYLGQMSFVGISWRCCCVEND